MTAIHQKAPWSRDKHGCVVDANGDSVLFRSVSTLSAGSDERMAMAEANTDLAAAAPDLLQSLEELLDAFSKPDQRICCSGIDCGCMGATTYKQAEHYARAAIAKARGTS